jgi:hypothetical protein
MTQQYDHTLIIDFDDLESSINAVYVPPGYRLIEAYYGGCDPYVSIDDVETLAEDNAELANVVCLLASDGPDSDINYKKFGIDIAKDLVLACNTHWGEQDKEMYLPLGVTAIWTSLELADPDHCLKLHEAAAFLEKNSRKDDYFAPNKLYVVFCVRYGIIDYSSFNMLTGSEAIKVALNMHTEEVKEHLAKYPTDIDDPDFRAEQERRIQAIKTLSCVDLSSDIDLVIRPLIRPQGEDLKEIWKLPDTTCFERTGE